VGGQATVPPLIEPTGVSAPGPGKIEACPRFGSYHWNVDGDVLSQSETLFQLFPPITSALGLWFWGLPSNRWWGESLSSYSSPWAGPVGRPTAKKSRAGDCWRPSRAPAEMKGAANQTAIPGERAFMTPPFLRTTGKTHPQRGKTDRTGVLMRLLFREKCRGFGLLRRT